MKKISKITLENFRAFLGKKEIDFNNSNNKPADFVCIYGKNGFGKTSLFDGFEWFFTGEIYLLEKELRNNVSTYAGTVLKNKYAHDWENAGISVEYSNGKKGHRTVVQKSNSRNDYGKGMPSGEYKELINKKQILPHSKIDSFVYANSPESMFEEWGNFWDPDKQQRNFFKAIYRVYKEIDNKTKNCKNQLRDILDDISILDIESKLKAFNLLVSEYNKMVIAGIGKLEPLEYRENEKIDIKTVLSGEKYIEPLTKYISNYRYLSEQCEYLEKHYNAYKDYEQYKEEVHYRKKRREAIIKKCNEKKILVEKKEDLISKRNSMIRNRDSLTALFDEQWFNEYHKYCETKTKCTKIDMNIQNCNLQRQEILHNIESFFEKQKSCTLELKVLSDRYIKWKEQIQELLVKEKDILSEDKQNKLVKKKKENKKKIEGYEEEQRYLVKASGGDYTEFAMSLEKDKLLQYPWITQFYRIIVEHKTTVSNCQKKEKEIKADYLKMKEDVDNLDELLTLAKNEIIKGDLHTCPVCKSSFSSMYELLKKIDLTSQQDILAATNAQWETCKEKLRKAEEDYEKVCSSIKEELTSLIYRNQKNIIDCKNNIAECSKEIEEIEQSLKEIEDRRTNLKVEICRNTGIDVVELTDSCVDEACKKKTTDIQSKIDEYSKKINKDQKEIDRLLITIESDKKLLEELKKGENDFYSDRNNQKRLEVLKRRELFSYADYLSLINNYNCEIEKILSEISRTDKLLQPYKIYYHKNVESYALHLNDIERSLDQRINTYKEYKNNVFKKKTISLKTIIKYKEKLDSKLDLARKKIEILNKCLSDLSIKEAITKYNCLEKDKIEKQKEKEFETCKLKIAEQILLSAQKQLEQHIRNVFGGITIGHIYEKIEPHKRFNRLEYQIGFNDNEKPELYIKVLNDKEEGVLPELFFSTAQLNTVALSVFLGGALSATNPQIKTIFIDDPIGNFDDLNVLSFIDVIRTIVSETDWQIIISTHEENFYEIMKVKLSPEYYNSKFLVFKDEGIVVEDDRI